MPDRTYTTPRIDKLGVRPGARCCLLGGFEPGFLGELRDRTSDISQGRLIDACDIVIVIIDTLDGLGTLGELRRHIRQDGAIWVVSRKGRAATIRDADVMEAARAVDLVDNKVVSFSDTQTALRLVIPRAKRRVDG